MRTRVRSHAGLFLLLLTIIMTEPACKTDGENEPRKNVQNSLPAFDSEKQITRGAGGRILTNIGVWSPNSEWIVFDRRSDPAGNLFDGHSIEMVNVLTGEVRELYRSVDGAHCGVATFHPHDWKVVFILGPSKPTPDWQYGPYHRQGLIVDASFKIHGTKPVRLDARDLISPFTPGALRGGSHVHVWDAVGERISFTYEDHVLAQFPAATDHNDINQRNIGVSVIGKSVKVPEKHPRNHDGSAFSVLVTRTSPAPRAGSDEISKAFEESWVGNSGYARNDGTRQKHALAFQGNVRTGGGEIISEVFIVDLPEDLSQDDMGPLAGTETRMPFPPRGCVQRRLTRTEVRKHPGIQGPRHWMRCSPDGSQIAFLMKDDSGVVQLWTISPNGGTPRQITSNRWSISSAFSWSPDGKLVGHMMDNSVCVTSIGTGATERLTPRFPDTNAPRPEACVFSPDGKKICYVRRVEESGRESNQIFVLPLMSVRNP